MICKIHNRVIRIGKCPLCLKDIEEIRQLDYEIRQLEKEIHKPIIVIG